MKWIAPIALALMCSACGVESKSDALAKLKEDNKDMLLKNIALQEDQADKDHYLAKLQERVEEMVYRHQNTAFESEHNELGTGNMDYHLTALSEYMEINRWELSKLRDSLLDEKGYSQNLRKKLKAAGEAEKAYLFALEDAERTIDDIVAQLDSEIAYADAIMLKYEEAEALRKAAEAAKNQVRLAYGTRQELKENGLIDKRGGFLGIGGALVASTGDRSFYSTLDKRETKTIPFPSEKCKILSNHPADSYEWMREDGQSILYIKNVEDFWKDASTLTALIQ